METNKQTVQVGPGFLTLLGIVFIVLKMTGYINWSWWWVLLPIYGPLAIVLPILILATIIIYRRT